jgi:hypothetical protein
MTASYTANLTVVLGTTNLKNYADFKTFCDRREKARVLQNSAYAKFLSETEPFDRIQQVGCENMLVMLQKLKKGECKGIIETEIHARFLEFGNEEAICDEKNVVPGLKVVEVQYSIRHTPYSYIIHHTLSTHTLYTTPIHHTLHPYTMHSDNIPEGGCHTVAPGGPSTMAIGVVPHRTNSIIDTMRMQVTRALSRLITAKIEDGTIESRYQDLVMHQGCPGHITDGTNGIKQLRPSDLFGVLVILGCGAALIVVVRLLKILRSRGWHGRGDERLRKLMIAMLHEYRIPEDSQDFLDRGVTQPRKQDLGLKWTRSQLFMRSTDSEQPPLGPKRSHGGGLSHFKVSERISIDKEEHVADFPEALCLVEVPSAGRRGAVWYDPCRPEGGANTLHNP